ncbi:MAG: hypothetical protein H7Y32_10915 [Chloroflexales bacterium]|nr:hypothetical protein [Chloroflexales bacterium]
MQLVMKGIRGLVALLVVAIAFAASALPTHAAPAAASTVTRTEEQINTQYWVTNPRGRAVTNRSVDLQPGQVVINDTLTGARQKTVQIAATFAPTLSNGRVTWALTAATVDGQPASAALQAQINARISSAWARYAKQQLPAGRVTAITITDSALTYTLATAP